MTSVTPNIQHAYVFPFTDDFDGDTDTNHIITNYAQAFYPIIVEDISFSNSLIFPLMFLNPKQIAALSILNPIETRIKTITAEVHYGSWDFNDVYPYQEKGYVCAYWVKKSDSWRDVVSFWFAEHIN